MQKLKDIDLVIAAGSETIQEHLQEIFAKHGANIVLCDFLDLNFVEQLENTIIADVILIAMDDSYEEDNAALDQLLEKIDLPILFHDNDFHEHKDSKERQSFSILVIERLVTKLAQLVDNSEKKDRIETDKDNVDVQIDNKSSIEKLLVSEHEKYTGLTEEELLEVRLWDSYSDYPISEPLADKEPSAGNEPSADKEPSAGKEPSANRKPLAKEAFLDKAWLIENKIIERTENDASAGLLNVWVLGASIGGPEAVKRFLARVPKELPVAFVLAQHLGDGFISLLAEQLDRISSFHVKEGRNGDIIKHGEVVVVPVENRMSFDKRGQIIFVDDGWTGLYKPSIDCVIDDVTSHFKKNSGVIIFSGMGADGVLASQRFAQEYNGSIWAQSSDSCVISSMPDSVREANLVSYSGSPEALALKIAVRFMGKESYIS